VGRKFGVDLADHEQVEALVEPFVEVMSPVELFTQGETVAVYSNERGRLSPSTKLYGIKLEPVGVGHHPELWDVLLAPAAGAEGIMRRQQIVGWLIDHPEVRADLTGLSMNSSGLKDDLTNFVNARYEEVHGSRDDESSSSRRHRDREEPVDPEAAKQKYAASLEASRGLAEQLTACDDDFLQSCGRGLRTVLEKAGAELDPDVVDQRVFNSKTEPVSKLVTKAASAVSKQAKETSAFPVFASHAVREGFVAVELTDDASAQAVTGMWNFKFKRTANDWGKDKPAQVVNDTPITLPTVLLTGNNASGKTFHQEARLFAQLSAQAFGYAPAEAAVIKPVRQIAVLERARTDAANELSAFGSEVKTLARVLAVVEELGDDTLVISDEGFSTTSPEDQATLLEATHKWLRKNGAAILAATHNEGYVDVVEQQEPDALFHLPYEIHKEQFGDKDIVVPTFRLEHGKDEAHAIEVARHYGLNEVLLERAQQYLDGDIQPTDLPERRWTQIHTLHPDTRRQRMYASANSRSLYPFANYPIVGTEKIQTFGFDQEEDRPVIRGFISDGMADTSGVRRLVAERTKANDIRTREPVYIYSGTGHGSGEIHPYDLSVGHFELGGSRNNTNGFIDEFLVTGAVFKPEEIMERQKFFGELLDPQKREAVDTALSTLWRMYTWPISEVGGHSHWYDEDTLSEPMTDFLESMQDNAGRNPNALKLLASLARWQGALKADTALAELADNLELIAALRELEKQKHEEQMAEDKDGSIALSKFEREQRFIGIINGNITLAIQLGIDGFEPLVFESELADEQFESLFSIHHSVTDALHEHTGTLIEKLKSTFEDAEQTIAQIDLETLSGFVPELMERIDALEHSKDWYVSRELPRLLKQAVFFADKEPRVAQAITVLRSLDSVHMHNLANHFETLLAAHMEGRATGFECGELLKERIAKLRSSDKHLWSHDTDKYLFSGLSYEYSVSQDWARIKTLINLAEIMASEGYVPAKFNGNGAIDIEGARNINVAQGNQTANSLRLNPNQQLHILTGANMSGKTFHLKQLLFSQLNAQTTGYAAAESVDTSLFSNIVYYDRPGNEEGRDLSAFATEIDQWNRILGSLEGKKRALVIIDEPFSSTSPRYQAALTFALVESLMAKGHTVVMATHHHQLADKLKDMYSDATDLAHFEIIKDGDEVTFSHKKQEGHAPSDAIAVARSLGGPVMQRVLVGL